MTLSGNNSGGVYDTYDLDSMLAQEIEDLNRDTPEDRKVKEAVIVAKPDPNQITYEDEEGRLRYFYDDDDDDDDYEENLAIRDPELFKITESNRKINIEHEEKPTATATRRPPELVFSDPPVLISEDDSIQASFYYGVSEEKESKRSRRYMMMCDFGEESLYALKWAIGTLLRDGDEVYIASIVDEDDQVEKMDKKEKKELLEELNKNSKTMISRVRSVLGDMLLYNIRVVVYSLAGRIKESLLDLIYKTPNLTMVVCGSRDRGSLKGMLMGSVSTFLVHNSPVPVSVVRPQKKEKKSKTKKTSPQKLSQSVQSGHLKVDEAEGASHHHSINSYDGTL
ncbi:adenine nucleotide alpha hydrolases-like protein [Backusella circina FSU 941]|nr:adenine nucleotide alpha hydrolases-like protein [Backusella circina FSU 941]